MLPVFIWVYLVLPSLPFFPLVFPHKHIPSENPLPRCPLNVFFFGVQDDIVSATWFHEEHHCLTLTSALGQLLHPPVSMRFDPTHDHTFFSVKTANILTDEMRKQDISGVLESSLDTKKSCTKLSYWVSSKDTETNLLN